MTTLQERLDQARETASLVVVIVIVAFFSAVLLGPRKTYQDLRDLWNGEYESDRWGTYIDEGCPHCGFQLVKKDEYDTCPFCGWGPDTEPHKTPQKARSDFLDGVLRGER